MYINSQKVHRRALGMFKQPTVKTLPPGTWYIYPPGLGRPGKDNQVEADPGNSQWGTQQKLYTYWCFLFYTYLVEAITKMLMATRDLKAFRP